jgi:hypothetical protein
VAAPSAELLDNAHELNGTEVVSGPRRPQLDLRHQERARVAQRPQPGLQAQCPRPRRSLLLAVAARQGSGGARWGHPAAAAAAEAEQASRRGEERGRGHAVVIGGLVLVAFATGACDL